MNLKIAITFLSKQKKRILPDPFLYNFLRPKSSDRYFFKWQKWAMSNGHYLTGSYLLVGFLYLNLNITPFLEYIFGAPKMHNNVWCTFKFVIVSNIAMVILNFSLLLPIQLSLFQLSLFFCIGFYRSSNYCDTNSSYALKGESKKNFLLSLLIMRTISNRINNKENKQRRTRPTTLQGAAEKSPILLPQYWKI